MPARRVYMPAVLLTAVLLLAGCFPNTFELTAQEVRLNDPSFTLVVDETVTEAGEVSVFGRTLMYEIDNRQRVWVNDSGTVLASFSTPSVEAMTLEANPVADMSPRELLDRAAGTMEGPLLEHLGFQHDPALSVANEEFVELETSLGRCMGSRFELQSDDATIVALIVQGKHEDDIIVLGAFYPEAREEDALNEVEEAVTQLEHDPAPLDSGGRPLPMAENAP